jgi:hypothetical protein
MLKKQIPVLQAGFRPDRISASHNPKKKQDFDSGASLTIQKGN